MALLIIGYIFISFNIQNIYQLQDVVASEIKPQEKYFCISYTQFQKIYVSGAAKLSTKPLNPFAGR